MSAAGGREIPEARCGRWQDALQGAYALPGNDPMLAHIADGMVHGARPLYCARCDTIIARQTTPRSDGTCLCQGHTEPAALSAAERVPDHTYVSHNVVRRSDLAFEEAIGLPVYGLAARESRGRGTRARKGWQWVHREHGGAVSSGWPFNPETMRGWVRERRRLKPHQTQYLPEDLGATDWWRRAKAGLPHPTEGWFPNETEVPCVLLCLGCGQPNLITSAPST